MSKVFELDSLKIDTHKQIVRLAKSSPELFKRVRKDYSDQLKLTLKEFVLFLRPRYKNHGEGYDNAYTIYIYPNNYLTKFGIYYHSVGGRVLFSGLKEGDNPIDLIMDFYNDGCYNKSKAVYSVLLENLKEVK